MDQVNFLKAVFHKIYLIHSWILCKTTKRRNDTLCSALNSENWYISSGIYETFPTKSTSWQILTHFRTMPPTESVLQRCSENVWHVCSLVNLLHIFKTPFLRNTSRGLLLLLFSPWEKFSGGIKWEHLPKMS